MKRDYEGGEAKDIKYFVGEEVEKTPAYGMRTLFVTGIQDIVEIDDFFQDNDCEHIFFGANHSFKPRDNDAWSKWEQMIGHFLDRDIPCSLDIPVKYAEEFLESTMIEYETFIPQLRIPIPYVKQWNYNTMIKIDDRGFKESNPGVWCHSLHDLMDRDKFTDWGKYSLDKILK